MAEFLARLALVPGVPLLGVVFALRELAPVEVGGLVAAALVLVGLVGQLGLLEKVVLPRLALLLLGAELVRLVSLLRLRPWLNYAAVGSRICGRLA